MTKTVLSAVPWADKPGLPDYNPVYHGVSSDGGLQFIRGLPITPIERRLMWHWRSIEKLPEFGATIDELQRATAVTREKVIQPTEAEHKVMSFLSQYLEASELSWNEATWQDLYPRFEQYVLSPSHTYVVFAPLHNFDNGGGVIEFSDSARVSPLISAHRYVVNQTEPIEQTGDSIFEWQASHMLEVRQSRYGRARLDLQRMLGALRLLKAGPVLCHHIYYTEEGWSDVRPLEPFMMGILGRFRHKRPHYGLLSQEVDDLVGIWKQLGEVDLREHRVLALALRRFDMLYERDVAEDRIVDSIIALEALFTPEKAPELRYRLSIRAAYVLAEPADRVRIYREVRDIYDVRCAIVHGAPDFARKRFKIGDQRGLTGAECASLAEDYVRRAAKWYLTEAITKDAKMMKEYVEEIPLGLEQ